jgi:hypothetical protein
MEDLGARRRAGPRCRDCQSQRGRRGDMGGATTLAAYSRFAKKRRLVTLQRPARARRRRRPAAPRPKLGRKMRLAPAPRPSRASASSRSSSVARRAAAGRRARAEEAAPPAATAPPQLSSAPISRPSLRRLRIVPTIPPARNTTATPQKPAKSGSVTSVGMPSARRPARSPT